MPTADFRSTHVKVSGSRGAEYIVDIHGGFPVNCTCPAFEYRSVTAGPCKHMRARSGLKAVGTTRCAVCLGWLTPAEIKDQPEPDPPDSLLDREFARVCSACSGS